MVVDIILDPVGGKYFEDNLNAYYQWKEDYY